MSRQKLLTVLIATDSEEDLKSIRKVWRKMKIANPLYAVSSGQECFDYLSMHEVGGIIIDPAIGRPNGIQVMESLRTDPRYQDIPVLAYTGFPELCERALGTHVKASAYVRKPMVKQLIQELAARHQLQIGGLQLATA